MTVGRRSRSRSRNRSNSRALVLVVGLAVGLLVAGFVVGPSAAFTTGSIDRGTAAPVVNDSEGFLGIDMAGSLQAGTEGRLVTVTNNLNRTLTVDVSSSASLSNDQATLGPSESLTTDATVSCEFSPNAVSITVTAVAGSQFSGTASRLTSVDTSGCRTDGRTIAFVNENTGVLQSVTAGGVVTTYNTNDIKSVGPPNADLDGDDGTEVPFVDENDNLRFVDSDGNTQTLDNSGNVESAPLGVGDYDASGTPEIYYVKNGNLFSGEAGAGLTKVVDDKNWDVGGVAGVADFDGDGALEVVFTIDKSDRIAYLDDTGSVVGATGKAGKVDTLRAISTPRDFDDDGTVEIAAYGSDTEGIVLYDASGTKSTFRPSPLVGETPLGSLDYNGDGVPDIIYLDSDQQSLYALDVTTGKTFLVSDTNGGPLTGTTDSGAR